MPKNFWIIDMPVSGNVFVTWYLSSDRKVTYSYDPSIVLPDLRVGAWRYQQEGEDGVTVFWVQDSFNSHHRLSRQVSFMDMLCIGLSI